MADEMILGADGGEDEITGKTLVSADTDTDGDVEGADNSAGGSDKTATVGEDQEGEGDSKSEDGDEADKDDKESGAPEQYEEFTAPEGADIDAALVEKATPLFKELNLDQAGAQKLVDLYAEAQREFSEGTQQAWSELQESWVEASKTDKEFGGDKFDESVGGANQVLKQFGGEKLNEALISTGAGNHPEFIRLLVNVRKALSDDVFVKGEPAGGERLSQADRLFGKKSD